MPFPSIILAIVVVVVIRSEALQLCTSESGGGLCPDDNTCCPVVNPEGKTTSGCIPHDMGGQALCCGDGKTGCPMKYTCGHGRNVLLCRSISPRQDPLVATVPRYRLCTAPQVQHVYGFPIDSTSLQSNLKTTSRQLSDLKLLYYSSHGCVLDLPNLRPRKFKNAVIVIHGSKRNADDYFCTLLAASQEDNHSNETLILAPRFPVATDSDLTNITNGGSALVWPDTDPDGTWRFGAEDLNSGTVSSFRAVDDLVRYLLKHGVAEHVTLAGHSSGGQFVQRWALVSSVESSRITYVVANPSSYAYLSPLRWLDGQFRLPNQVVYQCQDYNEWQWGFDPPYRVHYLQMLMEHFSLEDIRVRFIKRQVIYLIGSQDKCSGTSWCDSHGLETTCRDELQGPNRWERHFRYLRHLSDFGIAYTQYIVPGVGHDHSQMFNSDIGRSTLFPKSSSEIVRYSTQ